MAKRGESASKNPIEQGKGPAKKADRKALAGQEAARRAASTEVAAKASAKEATLPQTPQESVSHPAAPKSRRETVPVAAAETANTADTSTPSPTVAHTVDEERERAIDAAFERAKSSFDAAQQSGEGFLLKGTIATSIGTLKRKHGAEAVDDLLQRLEQAGVQDIDISKAGEGESGQVEVKGEAKIEDIGTLDNGLKPGEELIGLDLHYDNKEGAWTVVEKIKSAQDEEMERDAVSAYQDVVSAVKRSLGRDYFEDGNQRWIFIDHMWELKKELSAMPVKLVIDQSGSRISATIDGEEHSEKISERKDVRPSMLQRAKAQLRKDIIRNLTDGIITELQGSLAKKMGDFKSKARSAEWQNFQTGYGQTESGHTTIILKGVLKIGDRTIQLGNDREYGIEQLANIAGKRVEDFSGDDIIGYAKAKVLAELASSEPSLAEAIKTLSTTQEQASRPNISTSGGSRAVSQRQTRDAGRGATSPSTAKTRREPSDDRERPMREKPRTPMQEPRAALPTDAERLAMMQQELSKLNVQIAALDGEKVGVEKGSKQMEDIAWSQTSLLLEKRGLLEQMARLQSGEKPAAAPARGAEHSVPRKEAGSPTTPAKPEPTPNPEVATAPASAPKPEPAKPPAPAAEPTETENPELNDQKRQELTKQLERTEKDLGVRRKRVADLQARDEITAKARKGKPVKNTQLDYEKGQIDKLEARQAALRKQLGLEATSGAPLPMAAEKPITDEERRAILEQAKKDLPILVRQELFIIEKSFVNARIHADKLLSYGEEKVGAARAEAIDNAIEIINAAEKERSQVASALETATDIAQLQILVGKSSEMALQSAMAAHRLEAFAKEMVVGGFEESKVAETPTELDARIQEVQKRISALTESIRILREYVDQTNKMSREIGRDEGRRILFLEESSQLPDELKKKEAELRHNQELLADLMRQRSRFLSAPAADVTGPTTDEGKVAAEEPVEIPEDIKAMTEPQLRDTINAMMAELMKHYSAGKALVDILPSDKSNQGRRLLEGVKNNADLGDVWAELLKDETPTREELLGIYTNSQTSLRDSMNTLDTLRKLVAGHDTNTPYRPPLKAGVTRAVATDRVPEGMFDDREAAGMPIPGDQEAGVETVEESAVEKVARIAGARFYTGDWYADRVTYSFTFVPPGRTMYVEASYTISRDDIAKRLPENLHNHIAENGFVDLGEAGWSLVSRAAEECAAEKLLKRIESGELPEEIESAEQMRAGILTALKAIDALQDKHRQLFSEASEDINFLRGLPALHPESARKLDALVELLNENEMETVQFYLRRKNTILDSEETDIESKYLIINESLKMLDFALIAREGIFFDIKAIKTAEIAAMPFYRPPESPAPLAGATTYEEIGGTTAGRLTAAGGREPLQIGTGEAARELSPEETQEILVELAGLRGELAKLDQQETLLLQLLAQLDLEENKNQ